MRLARAFVAPRLAALGAALAVVATARLIASVSADASALLPMAGFWGPLALLAAGLGSALPSGEPGGWTWLLARPVRRARLLLLPLAIDALALATCALLAALAAGRAAVGSGPLTGAPLAVLVSAVVAIALVVYGGAALAAAAGVQRPLAVAFGFVWLLAAAFVGPLIGEALGMLSVSGRFLFRSAPAAPWVLIGAALLGSVALAVVLDHRRRLPLRLPFGLEGGDAALPGVARGRTRAPLLRAALRARAAVPLLTLALTGLARLGFALSSVGPGDHFGHAVVMISMLVYIPVLCALTGCLRFDGGIAPAAFVLARPVSRGAWLRATLLADLAVLGVSVAILTVIAGEDARQWVLASGSVTPGTLTWLLACGSAYLGASIASARGLSAAAAAGVGLLQALLGLGGVYAVLDGARSLALHVLALERGAVIPLADAARWWSCIGVLLICAGQATAVIAAARRLPVSASWRAILAPLPLGLALLALVLAGSVAQVWVRFPLARRGDASLVVRAADASGSPLHHLWLMVVPAASDPRTLRDLVTRLRDGAPSAWPLAFGARRSSDIDALWSGRYQACAVLLDRAESATTVSDDAPVHCQPVAIGPAVRQELLLVRP